jgi:membrane protease YdiL (CAAX protease family)
MQIEIAARASMTAETIDPTPVAVGLMLLLIIGLPLLASRHRLGHEELEQIRASRPAVYLSAALSLSIIALATLGATIWQKIPPALLGWRVDEPAVGLALAVATAGLGLLITWILRWIGQASGLRESPVGRALIPEQTAERGWFVLIAGLAAVCEEYIYRGFLLHILASWTGNMWLAAAITSLSFGLAHGYQQLIGITRSGLLGFLLAVPVIFTGSLFPAIVAHFWINSAIGLGGWRWLMPEPDAARLADDTDSTTGDDARR